MSVSIKNISNIKSINIIKGIKSFFKEKITLPKLVKDTFSRETKISPQDVMHKGDEFTHHIPEFITKDGDTAGASVREMIFSKKDTELMKKMALDEMMEYKANLIKDGKYTYK